MKTLRLLPLAVLCWLAPVGAEAAEVRLGVGADYLIRPNTGLFHVTISVDGALARFLRVGGRFGGLMTSGVSFGVPLDLYLRLVLGDGRVYLEGLVGPWLLFDRRDPPLELHGAVGFGLISSGGINFGLEVGALGDSVHAGVRLGLRI